MTIEMLDGVKVMKLRDDPFGVPAGGPSDLMSIARLWMLLTDGKPLRDGTIFARRLL